MDLGHDEVRVPPIHRMIAYTDFLPFSTAGEAANDNPRQLSVSLRLI